MTDPTLRTEPVIDYRSPQRKPSSITGRVVGWTIGGLLIVALLVSLLLPSLNSSRPLSSKIKCASNLKQIGLAMIMYANAHHDQYPDSLQEILAEEDITADVFTCPSTNDTPAVSPTTQATVVPLLTPHHCSYIYLARGLTSSSADANTVLAYEPLANHKNTGMNVLFGDGHVEFIVAPGVLPWIAGAKDGPVMRPGTKLPTTGP